MEGGLRVNPVSSGRTGIKSEQATARHTLEQVLDRARAMSVLPVPGGP